MATVSSGVEFLPQVCAELGWPELRTLAELEAALAEKARAVTDAAIHIPQRGDTLEL